jgi:4-amino-4-deoxy-L-arabinose transferase-like glycosyltransferase
MVSHSNHKSHLHRSLWVYLFGIFLIYATLSFYQINLPGLHYDEAFEAMPALQLLLDQPVMTFRNSGLVLGKQTFPLMTQDYIGAINTYAAIPFVAILGSTPTALRAMSIIVGGITLWLTYALVYRSTHTHWVGLIAALLLAVDPTFIFWNRQGVFVTAVTATIGLGAAYCWLRRFQSGTMRWSVAGAFLFGLGLYAKFLFLWLMIALIGAAILLNLDWLIQRRGDLIKRLSIREVFSVVLAFLLGCWPLIIYNIQTKGTFQSITKNAATSYYGVNNLALGANLVERLNQFVTLLNGGHFWYLGDVFHDFWSPILFFVVVFLVIAMTIRIKFGSTAGQPPSSAQQPLTTSQNLSPAKAVLFPLLVIGLVILASIGTVSALWMTHFAILMPWPAVALATGAWFILTHLDSLAPKLGPPIKFLIWAGLGLLVITHLFTTLRYHITLTESGGLSSHSDAVYALSDWLAEHSNGLVVAMDWGLAAPITYLTQGRVTPTEVFGYDWESDAQLTERLNGFIAQPATLYLWRAPDEIIFDRSDEFKTLYRPRNLEETIEEAFYEKSGRPILGITRLVKKGTASNPPK